MPSTQCRHFKCFVSASLVHVFPGLRHHSSTMCRQDFCWPLSLLPTEILAVSTCPTCAGHRRHSCHMNLPVLPGRASSRQKVREALQLSRAPSLLIKTITYPSLSAACRCLSKGSTLTGPCGPQHVHIVVTFPPTHSRQQPARNTHFVTAVFALPF